MRLRPSFRVALSEATKPLTGMWVCSGSALVAEICADSGLDWILIDAEHSPNGIESLLSQLQATNHARAVTLLRPPSGDAVNLKRILDLGAQNLVIPMVDSAQQAADLVKAVRYPPHGIRGVGSALARASRWNRIEGYLEQADDLISLTVQVETAAAVHNAAEIAGVDGIDSVFIGPSDLAASMGLLGQPEHPDVVAAVLHAMAEIQAAGKPVGVNAFLPAAAARYRAAGASFLLVGADVALLARGSEALAEANQ